MATTKNTKGQVVVAAKQLIAGTEKHFMNVAQVTVLGSSVTPAQIVSELQSLVTLRADVDASKASTKAKIANEATQMPALRAFMSAFVSVVNGVFGSSPDVLADFGIPASCPRPYARGEGGGRREARFNPRGAAHDGIEAETGRHRRRHRRRRDSGSSFGPHRADPEQPDGPRDERGPDGCGRAPHRVSGVQA